MPKVAMWFGLLLALTGSMAIAESQPPPAAVPGAPRRVIAVALPDAAIVAWVVPETFSNAAPITGYTITAFDNENPQLVAARAKARAPGAVVRRLSGGHCYTFRVHARNEAGDGPQSEPSEPICLPAPGADIQLTMTAPPSAQLGSELAFTLKVTNNGASDSAQVSIVDMLPAPLTSFTTSQGTCLGAVGGSNFGCTLGALLAGASATVTVTVIMGNADITNSAWASAYDSAGAALPDPVPDNNTANATVKVHPTANGTTAALP